MNLQSLEEGISVVIPNYNGAKLLPEILPPAMQALEETGLPFEIIVVDDASDDNTLEILARQFPAVKVVSNPINSGFSKTANNGIANARFSKTLLLNSDVKLNPGYFNTQLRYFEKPDTFGVMSRITGWEDDIIQDGAKFPSFHGAKIKTARNYLMVNEADMEEGLFSMYLSGANALMDTIKLRKLGGFDEIFSPFYVEDYELSLRAWRVGWKCYYDHQSICRHKISDTIKSSSRKKYVDMIYDRNKMLLHAIHLNGPIRILWFLQLLLELLIRVVTFRWAYLQSLFRFLTMFPAVADRRKKLLQKETTGTLISLEAVMQIVKSGIGNKEIRIF